MSLRYAIHPSIGVARVGNSRKSFYLGPEGIGALPIECDEHGNAVKDDKNLHKVAHFRDDEGCLRRQAARFRIFAYDDSNSTDAGREVTLDDSNVASLEWTVHLANKKGCWYPFRPFAGDPMYPRSSYKDYKLTLRNDDVKGPKRQKLIIDPGPRKLSGRNQEISVSRHDIPKDYRFGSFPPAKKPAPIEKLGDLKTDSQGRLLVLGGHGHASSGDNIIGLIGGDGWYDDISDGQITARLVLKDGTSLLLQAWVIVGAPKYAPEIVNIVTLDDIAFDVGVRYMGLAPALYESEKGWNTSYRADFERDIAPIFSRISGYIWVANVPSMVRLAAPRFDLSDASEQNRPNRENLFRYFRQPAEHGNEPPNQEQTLMGENGVPLLPLISGSNAVMNVNIDKFMTLTPTQYFLLSQWAAGKFGKVDPPPGIHALDRASLGNCIGDPMCPGIEVTWNVRVPAIYDKPYRIKPRFADSSHYYKSGLDPSYDEVTAGEGCEPGDLTKRMSIPWQSDYFWCTIQHVNFVDPERCVDEQYLPEPPTYYVYWWPAQSPVHVISGAMTREEQEAAGVDAGTQVPFSRGINSYEAMVVGWSYLGFIRNQNRGRDAALYPYFVETERRHDEFVVGSVAVGDVSNTNVSTDTTFMPVWFMKPHHARRRPVKHHPMTPWIQQLKK